MLAQVGAKTGAASRILGAHFFSPAHIMPLLEIVRTEKTGKQVSFELCRALSWGSVCVCVSVHALPGKFIELFAWIALSEHCWISTIHITSV
jgi:3-hydroxyacyl-CoA dehydrogenase